MKLIKNVYFYLGLSCNIVALFSTNGCLIFFFFSFIAIANYCNYCVCLWVFVCVWVCVIDIDYTCNLIPHFMGDQILKTISIKLFLSVKK